MSLKSKAIWVDVTFYPKKGGLLTHAQTCCLISLLQTTARTLSSISDNFIWQMLYCLFVNLAWYIFQTDSSGLRWIWHHLCSLTESYRLVQLYLYFTWYSPDWLWPPKQQLKWQERLILRGKNHEQDQIRGTRGNSTCKESDGRT